MVPTDNFAAAKFPRPLQGQYTFWVLYLAPLIKFLKKSCALVPPRAHPPRLFSCSKTWLRPAPIRKNLVQTRFFYGCPRQESNLHLILRTDLFYPLNYEGVSRLYHKNFTTCRGFCEKYNFCYTSSMTPEERSLLERTHKLAEENNEILRKMRRMNRISGVFRAIYWIVIIGVSVGAYYLIQPYVDSTMKLYNDAKSSLQGQMTTMQNISGTPR